MVTPREDDSSNGEGDVEEHVETEVSSEALVVARSIATLEYLVHREEGQRQITMFLKKACSYSSVATHIHERRTHTCGAVMLPAAHAMKVIARAVDFLVCPAMLREMREKIILPSAR